MKLYFGFGGRGVFKEMITKKVTEITIYIGKLEDDKHIYLFFAFFAIELEKSYSKKKNKSTSSLTPAGV